MLEQLYTIVNARYEDERSTIVTSNLGRDELAEQLGERIVSRLEGCCDVLPFYGPDHRQQIVALTAASARAAPRPSRPAERAA